MKTALLQQAREVAGGGILSTATAAMKQAEAAVKEIQQNEEARNGPSRFRATLVHSRD